MDFISLDTMPSHRADDCAFLLRVTSSTRIDYSTVAESGHNSLKPVLMIQNHYSLMLS